MKENKLKFSATPLFPIKAFENIGLTKTFIKDESKNPFGTIKDRRNFRIIQEANRLKVDKLVLITSGNNGYSLARFANTYTQIKVVCVVSKNISEEIKNLLRTVSYQVIELNLDHKILRPEELVAFAREKEDEVIWDVTNGYEENYIPVLDEITKEMTPDYIIVPIGSGGIFLGIIEGIEQRGLKTKVIGIGVQNTNHSFADKLSTPWTPYAKALQNYQKIGHSIYRLNEDEVKKTFKTFQNTVDCEMSSSVVFAAPLKHKFKSDDKIVFLNSGKTTLN